MGPSPSTAHPRPTQPRSHGAAIIAALLLSPLVNLLINRALDRSWHGQSVPSIGLGPGHWLFGLSTVMVAAIGTVLLLWCVGRRLRPGRQSRWLLELLGAITTVQALLNGALVMIAISSYQIGSLFLLLIGAGLYAVLNAIFLFWYWCLDHPDFGRGQPRFPTTSDDPRRGLIAFPEGDKAGSLIDYLYFTVLSSNTLGPPENHQINGDHLKLVQLSQSISMLVLLVVVVARAINTLG